MPLPSSGPSQEAPLEASNLEPGAGPSLERLMEAQISEPGAGPATELVMVALPASWVGPSQEIELDADPIPPPTEFAGPSQEIEMLQALLNSPGAGPAFELPMESSNAEPGAGPALEVEMAVFVTPGGGIASSGPEVPVVPPAPPPDISGVASFITDPDLTPPQRRALIAKDNAIRNFRVSARVAQQRYTGPAYPFGPSVHGTLGPKDDFSVVVTSMINILTTPRGSVFYDPTMGSDVPLLIFEPLDDITLNLIRYFTRKDLTEQEPRAVVRQVFAQVDPTDPNRVLVDVGFSLAGDPDETIYGIPVVFTRETVGGI